MISEMNAEPVNKDKEYIPNNVFKFRVHINIDLPEISVYTDSKIIDEEYVKEQYFTEEKLKELKEDLINAIKTNDNIFDIYCSDIDSNYKVTEDQLFEIKQNIDTFINNQKPMPTEFQQIIQNNFWDLVD